EAKRPQSVRDFMTAVEGRGTPASDRGEPPSIPAGENFMVEAPSQPLARATRAPAAPSAPAEPPSAEVAGNFMVEAPSVGRRQTAPPKEPLIARSRKSEQGPAPVRASDTLMVGGATIIVGDTGAAPGGEAASAVAATQPPARSRTPRDAASPVRRSKVPLIAAVVVVVLAGGGAAGYFAQRGGTP